MFKNFTDLILLIGTNPLPNYVVAKYFLQNNDNLNRIWLVYSEGQSSIGQNSTKEVAERIKGVIKKEFSKRNLKFLHIPIGDVSLARGIKYDLEDKIGYLDDRDDRTFHLNYTGGTKSMAVHSYRTLEELLGRRCSFSYLDGREHKLKFDDGAPKTNDLRFEISISLENLLDLHGHKKDDGKPQKDFSHIVEEFKEKVETEKKVDESVIDTLKTKAGEGDWFEEYVYGEIMCMIEKDPKLNKRYKNDEIFITRNLYSKKEQETLGKKNFELDLLIINGYQVCGISCTVSKKHGACKNRGFEVIHRANQIGGEEAKSILITCLPSGEKRAFADDLEDISGSSQGNLLVLGLSDLVPNIMWDKIGEYIWG